MQQPLRGLRILTVEQYGAGPYGTMFLADLGAEVIKIENPATGGDVSRATGPYYLGENDSQFFQTFNRNKKSVCLDLKSAKGRADFEALVASADAVVNNLRGDQPAKLGITYEALKAIKPSIVCAHLSAYGRDNERAGWPGYDYLMQAEAGFLSLTGEPDGPPARFGLSMVDFMSGMTMAFGLVSAVFGARQTGEGGDVDVALLDVALHQLSYPATWYLNEGLETTRQPRSAHPSIAPSQLFKAKDGWVLMMCQTPKFWALFCDKAECGHLAKDPRFAETAERGKNRAALQDELDQVFGTRTVEEWMTLLGGVVPIAPVYDIALALDNPFAQETGMTNTVAHPAAPDGVRMLSNPLKLDGKRLMDGRAPSLGEHTEALVRGQPKAVTS